MDISRRNMLAGALAAGTFASAAGATNPAIQHLLRYKRPAAVAGDSPPATGDLILWLAANDQSEMWQSNAGTTAVTANNDPVGYWGDKSASGADIKSIADDTTRPLYKTSGGVHWVEFDGSNDVLRRLFAVGLFNAGSRTILMAMRSSAAVDKRFISEGRQSVNHPFYAPIQTNTGTATTSSGFMTRDDGGHLWSNTTDIRTNAFPASTDVVYGISDAANGGDRTVKNYLDGVIGTNFAYTRAGTITAPDQFVLGGLATTTPGDFAAFRCYGLLLYNKLLSGAEMTAATTYLGSLQGRTL